MEDNKKIKFKDKTPLQKAWTIISTTIVSLFAVVAVVFLSSAIMMKVSGKDALTFGNTEVRLVLSGSMEWSEETPESHKEYAIKNINTYDAVFIEKAPQDETSLKTFYESLMVGDVVTINYKESGTMLTVTHRIVNKEVFGDGYKFTIQGDNFSTGTPGVQHVYTVNTDLNPEPFNYFIGKVTKVSPFVGGFMRASQSKVVIVVLILIPALAVIVFEIINIVKVVNKDKKEQLEMENTTKNESINDTIENISSEEEVEKLRKMLEEKEEELRKKTKDEKGNK